VTPERALAAVTCRLPVRGREWLAGKLFARDHARDEWWQVDVGGGLRLHLPASSRQSWVAAFTGTYDRDEVALLASHLRPGTVALDIGASLGLYTVQLAEWARSLQARVIAVEPIPANAAIIRANIDRNGLGAYASVMELALGIEDSSVIMRVERGGLGNATVATGVAEAEMARHASNGGLGAGVEIAVKPLDSLSFDAPVSVVKMDAEGFEMDILSGADRFIARYRPVIFAEFSEEWMLSRGRSLDDPFEWAAKHGYGVYKVAVERSGRVLKKTELRITQIESSRHRGAAELLLAPL
jgi:FkbM family methyltransferase